jgi:hypothetical protein
MLTTPWIASIKSRLVAKGYSERPGFDFKETFAPTVRYSTIRIVLALAALEDLELRSVDISHAYLNGTLEEEIYMQQPEGFEVGEPDHVCKLRKSLYGLKQAGRVWNQTLNSVFSSMGFKRVQSDHGLYIYLRDDLRILMPVFVDDITLACKDGAKIDSVVQELFQRFQLRDLGPTTQLLGLEIHRDRPNRRLCISQSQFITNLLQEHGLSDSKPVSTPLNPGSRLSTSMCPQNDAEALEMRQYPYISVVSSLMYLAVTTRPDIAYAAGVLARFNSNPGLAHWQAAKHVLHYLKGTTTHKLIYHPSTSPEPFITYSDADHGGNPTMASPLVNMWSRLVLERCLGAPSFSPWLPCPPLKLSPCQLLKWATRSCGCAHSWGSLVMTSPVLHCSEWTIGPPLQ